MNDSSFTEDFDTTDDENISDCFYIGHTNLETRFYTVLIFGSSLCVLAFFESIFLFYLLTSRTRFRNSTLFYLAILSIFDTILSPFWILLLSVPILYEWLEWVELYYVFLTYSPIMYTVSLTLLSASEYLILFASFENFLKSRQSKSVFHARMTKQIESNRGLVSLMALVVAAILQVSHYWEMDVKRQPNCTGFEAYEMVSVNLTASPVFDLMWTFYLRNLFDVFIPFFLLSFFNICIMTSLRRKRNEYRYSMKVDLRETREAQASAKAAVRALISDVLEYLISNALNVVLAFWETFAFENLVNYHLDFYDFSTDIVNILTVLFRAIRWPIYCFCNNDIRVESLRELKRFCNFFCGRKMRRRMSSSSSTESPCREILMRSYNNNCDTRCNNGDLSRDVAITSSDTLTNNDSSVINCPNGRTIAFRDIHSEITL